jgi:NAD(P)H dehydrogenase (quinone)
MFMIANAFENVNLLSIRKGIKMKIGITGATGQLGRLVVNKLKEKVAADNLVAIVRSRQKSAGLGIEAREADYDKPETLENALKGIDSLLLISASEIGKRLQQHKNVIEAAKKAGVKWIVYTSLLHADKSTIGLAGEHLATEAALKNSGIPFTLLRHSWYTENYANAVLGGLANGIIWGSAGDGKIASATRDDFAQSAVAVLTGEGHAGKIYELAGDEAFTMSDLAAEISKQTGKLVSYKNVPEQEYAEILVKAGLPEGFAKFYASVDISTGKNDLFDNSHQLSRLIGRATTPLSQVVADILSKA